MFLLPCGVIQRPDAKANGIARMKRLEFVQHQSDETRCVSIGYRHRCSVAYRCVRGGFIINACSEARQILSFSVKWGIVQKRNDIDRRQQQRQRQRQRQRSNPASRVGWTRPANSSGQLHFLHQDNVVLLLMIGALHLQRDGLADEVTQHGQVLRFFFQK